MSIIIDVTDTVTRQKKIEAQNQDLNDFAYMVSHDLKAPIFTIQGMADVLTEDYGPLLDKEGLELLKYITDAAKRLDKLVASVLEYSALSNSDGSLEEVSLTEGTLPIKKQHLRERIILSGYGTSKKTFEPGREAAPLFTALKGCWNQGDR